MERNRKTIVAIDVGEVNLGFCEIDLSSNRPSNWKRVEIVSKGNAKRQDLYAGLEKWLQTPEIALALANASFIVLEDQYKSKYVAMNAFIQSKHFNKTKLVNPKQLAKYFNLPQTRKEKKKAAVELVSLNTDLKHFKGKKDDLADAYLLGIFFLFNLNSELRKGWNELSAKCSETQTAKVKRPRHDGPAERVERIHTLPDLPFFF